MTDGYGRLVSYSCFDHVNVFCVDDICSFSVDVEIDTNLLTK